MKQEEQRILETFRARGIRTGGFIHPAEFGDAIVWEGGNIRDEVSLRRYRNYLGRAT